MLKNEINNFPEVLKNYLIKDFFPGYKKYIWFLKEEFKGNSQEQTIILKCTFTQHYSKLRKNDTEPKKEYLIRFTTEKMAG